jgi:hypothetical protein
MNAECSASVDSANREADNPPEPPVYRPVPRSFNVGGSFSAGRWRRGILQVPSFAKLRRTGPGRLSGEAHPAFLPGQGRGLLRSRMKFTGSPFLDTSGTADTVLSISLISTAFWAEKLLSSGSARLSYTVSSGLSGLQVVFFTAFAIPMLPFDDHVGASEESYGSYRTIRLVSLTPLKSG